MPYARGAVQAGLPQAAGYVVPNMMNDPALRTDAIEIAQLAAVQGVQVIDPMSQLLQFAQANDVVGLTNLFSSPLPWPGPIAPEGWARLVSSAQQDARVIADLALRTQARGEELQTEWDEIEARIKAQSTQLRSFMTQTTNAQASSHFESEAAASQTEANQTWKIGVGVVIGAAAISLLPLIAHYVRLATSRGPSFTELQLVSIHVTAALALGTLAGVLLRRSRVRDRNRQRNTDLAVALKMMFSYAQQIENEAERQQFISSNGRVVLEAYLRQESPPTEDPQPSGVFGPLANR